MGRIGQWGIVLSMVAVAIAPTAACNAESLAYINYWDLSTTGLPVELYLDQKPIATKYLPDKITPSQAIVAGQHSLWLNTKPRIRLTNVNMEAGQFYTFVLLKNNSDPKGIVLNDKLERPEPTLRLVNLTADKIQITIRQNRPLEVKPGEQKDVPVVINNDSKVGLITVSAASVTRSGMSSSVKKIGIGPDRASVLLIDEQKSTLRLTRWQYDKCAVRIQTFKYSDACGHSD